MEKPVKITVSADNNFDQLNIWMEEVKVLLKKINDYQADVIISYSENSSEIAVSQIEHQ